MEWILECVSVDLPLHPGTDNAEALSYARLTDVPSDKTATRIDIALIERQTPSPNFLIQPIAKGVANR
jgi:hypothetical protein